MRRSLSTVAIVIAVVIALTSATPLLAEASPASPAPPTVAVKPGTIARGPDVAGPHLDGTTIVDGDVSVRLRSANAVLYGKWDDQYVAATANAQFGNVKLWLVSATGEREKLAAGIDPFNTVLDAEADQVAYSLGDSVQKPTIAVFDLGLDKEVALSTFSSLPRLLEFDEGLVVVSLADLKVKTLTWDTVSDETLKVIAKQSNYASAAHDLLGYFSKDPQIDGGCQVLAHLSDPGDVLWTNCDERIEAVSPDGKRVATIPLLSDGIGPADIVLRKIGGTALAQYTINGFFGRIWWETPTKLLMEANGRVQAATVRCKVTSCNRASDLRPTPDLRRLQQLAAISRG